MTLSWNEIRTRAIQFTKEWENETSEDAEAKSFWDDFFQVFGLSRRRVATFEQKVTKGNRKDGFIDLLWKGQLLVEHKSSGKSLDRAYKQAIDYFPGLKEYELPKYILVCNFQNFRLYDLDEDTVLEFQLSDLSKNIEYFGFIAGYHKRVFKEEDPVNIEAAEMMGKLHDKLSAVGYSGHSLEVYLVRLLFCMFADDTSIFEKGIFEEYISQKTNEDGSDLAAHLSQIFEVLNKPKEKRLTNLDESLSQFPYVNGKLFEEQLQIAAFDSDMRKIFLQCCRLDWGKISPAIFGSLFQSVMNPEERRNLGAHYTSEKNILKLIKPLFLDDLWKEFETVKESRSGLQKFHDKLASLRFLDPACGCGNFLVITYRELRLIEIEVIRVLQKQQLVTDISNLIKIDVDKFYGIECEEFPAQIAQVAMWLIDHQMNMRVSDAFGEYFIRLPLRKSPVIIHGNSLRIDWNNIVPLEGANSHVFDYIIGNPPFIGKQHQNEDQKDDFELIWHGVQGAGVLDYVTCWYIKAAEYLQKQKLYDSNRQIKVAFVSTNSIAQGEKVGVLWNILLNKFSIRIHFAHRTFSWTNEARGKAAVHVVIIGFSNYDESEKYLYEYETVKSDPHERKVKNINPYLIESNDSLILKRSRPICSVPVICFGNMPNDGGHLLLSDKDKLKMLEKEPEASKYIRPLLSAREFLNGEERWCLWLKDIQPTELKQLPEVMKRVELVRKHRLSSNREATKNMSAFPSLFGEIRQPTTKYILIPRHSSENRKYIPMGFFDPEFIVSDSCLCVADANLYHFGILMSQMHMVWVKNVCGRIKSDYRYSNEMVYNNYPWPENPAEKYISEIENAAGKIINVRNDFSGSSLSDIYDPLAMPQKLVKAHQLLDKVVDLAYRPQPFSNEARRMEFLFELYNKYTADIFTKPTKKAKRQ